MEETTSGVVEAQGDVAEHKHYVTHHDTHHHHHKYKEKDKEMIPQENINLFTNPGFGGYGMGGVGAGAGAGLGAGLLGGVLGGALLGNNGVLGNRNNGAWPVEGVVTPTQLQTGLDSVTDQLQSTTILQTLGNIQAAVPLAEAQVQLALAGVQNDITTEINAVNNSLAAGQFAINKNVSDTTAQIIATEVATQAAVNTASAATQLGIANLATAGLQNTYSLANAIRDDGDKTRALLISQNDATLQRQLAVAEAALMEQRAIGRSRDVEVNVSQTVNQAQAQNQSQLQAQQQAVLLSNIWTRLEGLQNAVSTQGNLLIGNTGTTSTGAQTSAPINVR